MYDPEMTNILAKFNTAANTEKKIESPIDSNNEMLSILARFDLVESKSKLTPVNVKHGLNAQQKSVGQVGPEFKPKTTRVLTAPTDPKNPFAGKLVGGSESVERNRQPLDEADVAEDVLSDVKKSLKDYLKQLDDIKKQDDDLKKKKKQDTDLKKKQKPDSDVFVKRVKEDPTQENPVIQPKPAAIINPSLSDSPAIEFESLKTVECSPGRIFEIIGDENQGFNIRHQGKISPSKFRSFIEADAALELFKNKLATSNSDYKQER